MEIALHSSQFGASFELEGKTPRSSAPAKVHGSGLFILTPFYRSKTLEDMFSRGDVCSHNQAVIDGRS